MTRFLSDPHALDRFPADLIHSGLFWYWTSERSSYQEPNRGAGATEGTASPVRLTRDNANELRSHFSYADPDGYGYNLLLFGATLEIAAHCHRPELTRFCEEKGAVEIAIFHLGDGIEDYIFVKHEPDANIKSLLTVWGATGERCLAQRRYEELGPLRLEQLLANDVV
jgi:hypothetical protein